MTELLGEWMRSIAGAALICSAAMMLTPKGKAKSVLHLVCGLVLICAVLSPIAKGETQGLSMSIAEYKNEAAKLTGSAQNNSNELSRTIIERELAAYILDKARESGSAPDSVALSMRWSSDGYWYPDSVTLRAGGMSVVQKKRLEGIIEAELGIPAERQHWRENED